MAAPKRTRGFTLVELLVVITIIGMLVSLLLPAIQSAREAGRRNTCSNNMRNAALAITQYESSKRQFPGYANSISVQTSGAAQYRRVSWVVPILPYLERNDLYQNWQNPTYTTANIANALIQQTPPAAGGLYQSQFVSQLAVLLCPSNPNPNLSSNPLSFCVNTGLAYSASDSAFGLPAGTTTIPEDVNSGVFFNHSNWDGTPANPPGIPNGTAIPSRKTNVDFISTNDGTTYTLMMSENLQSYNWATDPMDASGTLMFANDFAVRQGAGMVWFLTQSASGNNYGPPQYPVTSTLFNVNSMGVNDSSKTVTGAAAAYVYSTMNDANGLASGLAYARPSSQHPGGVNSIFVGGNMRFINDEVAYHVFTQLMTSNQNAVNVNTGPGNPMPITARAKNWTYTLNEADY